MKTGTTRRHQTVGTVAWNATVKRQIAVILEATFGPENDDEPGCHAFPYPSKMAPGDALVHKITWCDEDEEGGDGRVPHTPHTRRGRRVIDGDENDRGGGWSKLALLQPRLGDDDDTWFSARRVLFGPQGGNDGGWDALLPGQYRRVFPVRFSEDSTTNRAHKIVCGDDDETDGEWERTPLLPRTLNRRGLRITLGDDDDEEEEGGGWCTLALSQQCLPHTEESGKDGILGDARPSTATRPRRQRMAALISPSFGRDDDEE